MFVIKWTGWQSEDQENIYIGNLKRGQLVWIENQAKAKRFETRKAARSFIKEHLRNGSFGGGRADNVTVLPVT